MAGEVVPYAGKRKHSGQDHRSRLELGEKILARRNKGETFWEIAKTLKLNERSARRYLDLALASRVAPTADLFRRQQNDRLDQTQRSIEENMEAANKLAAIAIEMNATAMLQNAIDIRTKQIALQLRLDERRARLNGLDAPVKAEVTVTQVDPVDHEMAELVREAQMRSAARQE